jgi:hypothetical protein
VLSLFCNHCCTGIFVTFLILLQIFMTFLCCVVVFISHLHLYVSLYEVIQISVGESSFACRRRVVQTPTTSLLRCALLWDCTERRFSVLPTFRDKAVRLLKLGSTGCPEMPVTAYHSTLRKIPEGSISHLIHARSLKSRTLSYWRIWT